jgi:hypothetical protein
MINLKELIEEEGITSYQIYCDMDGVIADFEARFDHFFGMSPSEYEAKNGRRAFWNQIDNNIGVKFWVGIPWMPDGHQLWDYIKKYNPILLSSPSTSESSRIGKRLWVKKYLPGTKLILAFPDQKANYSGEGKILIDDRLEPNIQMWRNKGGIGIHHTSASDTISQLKELGL